jgi:hypothetical protein
MYKYRIVKIKHSPWTGKAKENIGDIIEEYAENGWRLVQVLQPNYYNWSMSGGMKTEIIFEKTMEEYMKDRGSYREDRRDIGEFV